MAKQLNNDAATDLNISSVVYLATKALNWKVSFSAPPGSYAVEVGFEVFNVDEEKIQDFVVENFYKTN